MSNAILVVSVVMVMLIVLSLGGYSLYNYATFVAPLKSWTPDERYGFHEDWLWIDPEDRFYPYLIYKVTHNESDESITVVFSDKNSPEHFKIDQKFTHTERFYPNQSFAFSCDEYDQRTALGVFKYIGIKTVEDGKAESILHYVHDSGLDSTERPVRTDGKVARVLHYDGYTKAPVPCIYPDVLVHAANILNP